MISEKVISYKNISYCMEITNLCGECEPFEWESLFRVNLFNRFFHDRYSYLTFHGSSHSIGDYMDSQEDLRGFKENLFTVGQEVVDAIQEVCFDYAELVRKGVIKVPQGNYCVLQHLEEKVQEKLKAKEAQK